VPIRWWVGYENQLLEWSISDPARWQRIRDGAGPRPVMLYPQPTVFSAHPLIAIAPESLPLIDATQAEAEHPRRDSPAHLDGI
jgi:hypothetical protein